MTTKINGFSLLQLTLCICIIGFLAVQNAGSFTVAIKRYSLRGAIQSVFFTMQLSRSQAIVQQQIVVVDIHEGEQWCIGLTNKADCDCQIASSCTINDLEQKVDYQDFQFIELEKSTFKHDNQTRFNPPRGLTTGYAGSLTFTDGSHRLKLILSNVGRVRICTLTPPFSPYKRC